MTAHLDLQSINKYFGQFQALKNISLTVDEGEFVCLLGPSGCGKTTLLRIIAGFEQASSGNILLNEEPISHLPPHKRDFGMVFQSLALFPHMTVAENISYGMKRKRIPKAKRADRVQALLEMVQLPNISTRRVSDLSGGQQQRVAIARALAVPPELFLLDEPLSALDAQIRENMQIELRQLQQKFGVTTILVTHDQHEAMMLADKLVVLKDGEVQQVASPSDTYRQPQNQFVASFLGAANLLPCVVNNKNLIVVFGNEIAMKNDFPFGQNVKLAVRSEDIVVTKRQNDDDNKKTIQGNVSFIRDLGTKVEILVNCEEQIVRCHAPYHRTEHFHVGEPVSLTLCTDHCTLFA